MMSLTQKVDHLKKCTLFEGLPPDALKVIAMASQVTECGPGEILFREGDESNEAYVVFEGEAEAFSVMEDGRTVVLSRFIPWEIFGEFALIGDVPRTAGVRTGSSFTALKIRKEVFLEYIRQFPDVAIRIMRVLIQRVLVTSRKYVETLEANCRSGSSSDSFKV